MRAWVAVVVGAVLPLVMGMTLGNVTSESNEGTWAHPMAPTAFLLLSLGLALSHLLVLTGYVEVARGSTGAASRLAAVGGVGTALVAACEVWSGLLADADLDAAVITVLDLAYGVAAVVIVVGTLGAGLALHRAGSRLGAPLVLNGVVLLLASLVRFAASDLVGVLALTVWSLTYVWFALRLRAAAREPAVA